MSARPFRSSRFINETSPLSQRQILVDELCVRSMRSNSRRSQKKFFWLEAFFPRLNRCKWEKKIAQAKLSYASCNQVTDHPSLTRNRALLMVKVETPTFHVSLTKNTAGLLTGILGHGKLHRLSRPRKDFDFASVSSSVTGIKERRVGGSMTRRKKRGRNNAVSLLKPSAERCTSERISVAEYQGVPVRKERS